MTESVEKLRADILSRLARIVEESEGINSAMQDVPHRNGVVSRSLKPKSHMYITHTEAGFLTGYIGNDGKIYQINIQVISD